MNRKNVFLLLISLLIISLFSNVVFASHIPSHTTTGAGLGGAFDIIKDMFEFLPELITLEKLLGGTDEAAKFWARFLIWLLLFSIIYFGAGFVFKDNKRIQVVVSIVISLMGTLLIPQSFIVGIFQTYGLVAGVVVWTIPLAAGVFIAQKITNPFVRALIFGISAWVLISINETLIKTPGFPDFNFPFFGLLFAVVIILFFWNLGAAFGIGGGGGVGNAIGGLAGRGRDAVGNWLTPGGRGDDEGDDRDQTPEQRRRARGDARRVEQAERLNASLVELEGQLTTRLERTEGYQVRRIREIAGLITQLRTLQAQLRREMGR